jgi:IclR family KDG regulon transcriptional repressor
MAVKSEVKSANRVFSILKIFQEVQQPMRLREIVVRSGFPTSSTAALLKSMANEGMLNFDRRARTYFPSERLLELVQWLAFRTQSASSHMPMSKGSAIVT